MALVDRLVEELRRWAAARRPAPSIEYRSRRPCRPCRPRPLVGIFGTAETFALVIAEGLELPAFDQLLAAGNVDEGEVRLAADDGRQRGRGALIGNVRGIETAL